MHQQAGLVLLVLLLLSVDHCQLHQHIAGGPSQAQVMQQLWYGDCISIHAPPPCQHTALASTPHLTTVVEASVAVPPARQAVEHARAGAAESSHCIGSSVCPRPVEAALAARPAMGGAGLQVDLYQHVRKCGVCQQSMEQCCSCPISNRVGQVLQCTEHCGKMPSYGGDPKHPIRYNMRGAYPLTLKGPLSRQTQLGAFN